MNIRFFRLLFIFAFCFCTARGEGPLGGERVNGFVVAGHAWTWGKGTLMEAIDNASAAGTHALEVFLMGMQISEQSGEAVLDETTPDDLIEKIKAQAKQRGVPIINAYIGQKQWTRIGQDEAALRKFFEFGKKLGISGFTGEPAESQWDMVERLIKEFDLTFAIHNHAKGFEAPYLGGEYRYWDPRITFEKLRGRDARFGICLDTGHLARSGLENVAVLKAIEARCLSVHLKDITAANLEAHDVPYGKGIVNVAGFLNELRRQKIAGHIGLEYEWTESPTFSTDVKGLVEFIRNPPAAAGFPPLIINGEFHGEQIGRTMRLLATSTAEKRNTVRILFYGQSITEQNWSKLVAADLRARFPFANLLIENRALGGFASQMLVKTAETDLYPFQPDLVIFHVYGAHDKYEEILRRVRERTTAEILQQNDHVTAPEDFNEETDPAKLPPKGTHWNAFMNYNWLPSLARKYGTEYCDQRGLWKEYLKQNGLEPKALLKDGVHLNAHGEFLMAEIVKAHLRYDAGAKSPAEDWVKTLEVGKELRWDEGSSGKVLRAEFEGSRVDLVLKSGTAASIRIDEKKPSEIAQLYGFSRALAKPGGKWPVLAELSSEKSLLLEEWSMDVQHAPGDEKLLTFTLSGSKTGPDGAGRSDARFVSNSGRVVIDPEDWNASFALMLSGIKPVPEHFNVRWSVVPYFVDEVPFAEIKDATIETTVTVAQGLANTRHTLEISGSEAGAIQAVRIYRPPLGRQ